MSVSHSLNLAFEKESIRLVQHEVFACLLKTLSDHIQVKFQSIQESPMDAHHLAMFIFLLALFTYATAVVVEVMLRASESIYHTHVGNIRLFAGGLAALLLLSVLDPLLGCIISVIWVCLYVKIAYESFQELYRILCQIIAEGRHMLSTLSWRCLEEEVCNRPSHERGEEESNEKGRAAEMGGAAERREAVEEDIEMKGLDPRSFLSKPTCTGNKETSACMAEMEERSTYVDGPDETQGTAPDDQRVAKEIRQVSDEQHVAIEINEIGNDTV